ncbi:hypothetical protein E2C01_043034 [Portunus trituberculatus]|uniref:Uncharacterized protein n=1 Tax=Portunus trituberculatus TaxID=210409 RepID=A0A5B7FV05_PORTR|nr:hypothetical protein [Portunus trituberculatus]
MIGSASGTYRCTKVFCNAIKHRCQHNTFASRRSTAWLKLGIVEFTIAEFCHASLDDAQVKVNK